MSDIEYLIGYPIVGAQNTVFISRISIILANTVRKGPWLGDRRSVRNCEVLDSP